MRSGRFRIITLALVFLSYAVAAAVVLGLGLNAPRVGTPGALDVLSQVVIALVALAWAGLLFREMDNVIEQLLIFTGAGLVFTGALEGLVGLFRAIDGWLGSVDLIATPVGFALLTGGLAIRMIRHRAYANRLRTERDAIEDLALRDPLTGLHNRRYLRRELERLLESADARKESICLAFIDADDFKEVNDRHGHDSGDAFLVGLAKAISDAVRESDIAVRFGGDEFVVVLVGSGVDHGVHVMERVQQQVRRLARPYGGRGLGAWNGPSISVGIAAHVPGETGLQLIARADEAMYAAKREGKNRVAVA